MENNFDIEKTNKSVNGRNDSFINFMSSNKIFKLDKLIKNESMIIRNNQRKTAFKYNNCLI